MSTSPRDELDAILVQAHHLRSEQPKNYTPSLRSEGYHALERFSVYKALFPWRLHLVWWLMFLAAPAANSFLPSLSRLPIEMQQVVFWLVFGISLVAAARIIWHTLTWFGNFASFRGWRRRLHLLRIEGWSKMVANPQFANYRYWRQCTIHLHLLSSASLNDHALQTLLFMFCTEANHCGYPADTATDQRQGWTLKGSILSGSVNCHVARQIHELCRHLSILNRVEPTVESLLIITEEDGWLTEPFSSRGQV